MWETGVSSLGQEDPLGKGMAIHSSILAWRIPWTEEPGRLLSQRVTHNWATNTFTAQSCPTLCDPMDCSPPGSSVHGVFQARILERVAISFSRGSSQPRDWTQVSCISGRFFTVWATREAITWATNLQSYEKQKSVLLIGLAVFFKENMKDTGLTDKSF